MAPSRDDRFSSAAELARALNTRVTRERTARLSVPLAAWIVGIAALSPRSRDAGSCCRAPPHRSTPISSPSRHSTSKHRRSRCGRKGSSTCSRAASTARETCTPFQRRSSFERWKGRADAQSARALGEATGARLVLYGGLLSAGDSVRATLSLLDVKTGRAIAEIEQRDLRCSRRSACPTRLRSPSCASSDDRAASTSRMRRRRQRARSPRSRHFCAASNSIARQTGIPRKRTSSGRSRSIRRSRSRTIVLAAVRRWRDAMVVPDSATYELMRRPSRFPRGLGPRDRLLATIDSLSAESYFAWRRGTHTADYADQEALVHRLYATLDEGVRRYPNDAELWLLFGEARYQFDSDVMLGEIDDRAILALYDRAIASGFRARAGVRHSDLARRVSRRRGERAPLHRSAIWHSLRLVRDRRSSVSPICCSIRIARRRSTCEPRRHVASRSPVRGDDVAASRSRRG